MELIKHSAYAQIKNVQSEPSFKTSDPFTNRYILHLWFKYFLGKLDVMEKK